MSENTTKKINFNIETNCPLNIPFMQKHGLKFYDLIDQLEVFLIIDAVKRAAGNHTKAAEILGINRTTFQMKLYQVRKFDVELESDKKKTTKPQKEESFSAE